MSTFNIHTEDVIVHEQDGTQYEENKAVNEPKYEISLLYDDSVSRHPTNREELQSRCSLIYNELKNQNVSLTLICI